MRRCLAVALVAAVLTGCSGTNEPGELALSLEADGAIVTATLANGSTEPVRVVRPTVTPNFIVFIVEDADGNEFPYRGTYPQLRPLSEDGFADLEPGDATSVAFDLIDLYPLAPGSYQVTAEYRNPARGSHEGTSAVVYEPGAGLPAGPVEITVP